MEKYEELEIEVIEFESEDVITTSGDLLFNMEDIPLMFEEIK